MKLQYKIAVFTTIILVIVVASIGALSYEQMESTLRQQLGGSAMDLAVAVSELDLVKDNVGTISGYIKIQQSVETIRLKTHVQFIVVMDMNGVRYSHPVPENIGRKFSGNDDKRVLTTGESYISEGQGTLGPSIRAFVPVYRGGEQVGAVCVGILTGWVNQELWSDVQRFIPFLIIGLLLGTAGAVFLSYDIKKTIFGLEPAEIAMLLNEREAIIQSVTEGIAAYDLHGKIIFFNQAAKDILELDGEDSGEALFNDGRVMEEILAAGKPIYNKEIKIRQGITVICNYYPLKYNDLNITGVVVSFRDMTKVKQLAEELTGIKKLTWVLRAQNHEFMNKLHTISGLIQLEEYDHAVSFISEVAKTRQDMLGIITDLIKDPSLAGLLLAKYNKAEENRVVLDIDPDSMVNSLPEDATADEIISVVGNLIENAMEALIGQDGARIKVKIYEKNGNLNIEVSDNGPGIPCSIQDRIYERGITTRDGQRGLGLSIVKKIVDEACGDIHFIVDNGTKWYVSIPLRG
jgi:two-component system CitB family sensor kinase